MEKGDDTVRTGAQAGEDSLMALLEHGQLPGMEWCDDVDGVPKDAPAGHTLVIYRVPRWVCEAGTEGGAIVANELARLPQNVRGGVMLSFDGWADDPRPMCAIPCGVAFCRGLLGIDSAVSKIDLGLCKRTLSWLMDEEPNGLWEATGSLWVVAHAFPDSVFEIAEDRWLRAPDVNIGLRDWLLEGCP